MGKVSNDLLGQCDIFHVAKHAVKYIGFSQGYDVSYIPIDEQGTMNDLQMTLSGVDLKASQLSNVLHFAPNINSVRRLKVRI